MIWRARHFEFAFPRPALVMGVLNVTPDSFSDGGRFLAPEAAVAQAHRLVADGADILDVGGESTRPGATPVTEQEELDRVIPVIEHLARGIAVPISVDTFKPNVARAALAAGASIINDIAANLAQPGLWECVATSGAGYVAMHMQGTPRTMQMAPTYRDVVREVDQFFRRTLLGLAAAGVAPAQVVLDPGIGFGKTLEHNLELLGRVHAFTELDRPLLLGVSRKSFLGKLLGTPVDARLPGSLAATCLAVADGVGIIRAHDVRETVQAIRVVEAIRSRAPKC